ncbi:UNKNOWN [Stylonychia lemnae]|uniref:Uncharacterized protein n=1 Tax=Stylonychia lemnae TaxID=5949 RepID=A0A078ARL8_STYLE|nr:UNKNOWN [Stylonychia lemnae]|eukprot:CDW85120.1 UNKNOWN [Stylonychia lemnae]
MTIQQMNHKLLKSFDSIGSVEKQYDAALIYGTSDNRMQEQLQNNYFNYPRWKVDEGQPFDNQLFEPIFQTHDNRAEKYLKKKGYLDQFITHDDQSKSSGNSQAKKASQGQSSGEQQYPLKQTIQQKMNDNQFNKQLMQSFLDRRAILNLKKRQTIANHLIAGFSTKSITTPNSPRVQQVKQIKHSDKSNGSYGGAELTALDEIRIDPVNVALLNEKLAQFQQQQLLQQHLQQNPHLNIPQTYVNLPQTGAKQKIVLPKGIINFSAAQSRGHSSGGSKSAERTHRRQGQSHEPREESLRRKKKVMQIIRNFENDNQQLDLPQHTQAQPQIQPNHRELSFLLKSKMMKHQDVEIPQIGDTKGKVIIHKRITKTFLGKTPDQSQEKIKIQQPLRQRDKIPQPLTRGESPLMSDLNSYIMLKDHDVPPGQINRPMHQIGLNPPTSDDLMQKLYKFQQQQQNHSLNPSKSRERKSNHNQLLINLQNFNFKHSNLINNSSNQNQKSRRPSNSDQI